MERQIYDAIVGETQPQQAFEARKRILIDNVDQIR